MGTEDRVSVKSGHGVGKSCDIAEAVLWFLYSFDPSIVVTTAPTERQVREILWREIRHRKSSALISLPGVPLTMKLDLGPIHYALGFSTNEVNQIQGFHSPNIMVAIDEANGYPEELMDAIEGLISGGERRILIMIGNPIKPSGRFFQSFSDGMTWTHTISCLDHPNVVSGKNIIPGAVTKGWVDRQRKLWGEDSAFWESRVLGIFPRISSDIIVNLVWVEVAEGMKVKLVKDESKWLGYDPAAYGSDDNSWYVGTSRRCIEIFKKRRIELPEKIGITKRLMREHNIPERQVTIDAIGPGGEIASGLKADGININKFEGSKTAKDDKSFINAITEAWFNLRTMLKPESPEYNKYSLSGKREILKAELCTRKYNTASDGRLQIEPKETYRKRLKRSPNEADSMAICYSPMCRRIVYGLMSLPNVI